MIRELLPEDLSTSFFLALQPLTGDKELGGDMELLVKRHERFRAGVQTFVYLDKEDGKIVGTASLFIEPKLIHGGCFAGHIEDVSVAETHQGRGVGRALVEHCVQVARQRHCYKVVLECDDDVVKFYEKLGFRISGHAMRMSCHAE